MRATKAIEHFITLAILVERDSHENLTAAAVLLRYGEDTHYRKPFFPALAVNEDGPAVIGGFEEHAGLAVRLHDLDTAGFQHPWHIRRRQ